MMDFKEFSIQMESDLRRYLDDNSPGTQIRQNDVEKMQGQSYQALTINPEGSPIGMNINLTRMYEQMQDGAGYDAVLDQVLKQTDNFLEEVPDFDVKSISNYEQSKSRLFVEVVSAERNADMLQNMPHMQIEDMAMIYRLQFGSNEHGMASNIFIDKLVAAKIYPDYKCDNVSELL